jgi:hypothetical protein
MAFPMRISFRSYSNSFPQFRETTRYLEGTLPNGLAFTANGDILVSNFGTDRLEIMTREGDTRVLADNIDGMPNRQGKLRAARFQESDLDHGGDADLDRSGGRHGPAPDHYGASQRETGSLRR